MDSSPFAKIPPELRNHIWRYALYCENVDAISAEPGLLKTCKEIRSETEKMYYAVNAFQIKLPAPTEHPRGDKAPQGYLFSKKLELQINKIKRAPLNHLRQMLPITVIGETMPEDSRLPVWTYAEDQVSGTARALCERLVIGDVRWRLEWPDGTPDVVDEDGNTKQDSLDAWWDLVHTEFAVGLERAYRGWHDPELRKLSWVERSWHWQKMGRESQSM